MIFKMNLTELPLSNLASISGFAPGISADFRRRLREIGFCEGAIVQYLRAIPFGGPRVFRVCDAVFSIEPDVASKIEIEMAPT